MVRMRVLRGCGSRLAVARQGVCSCAAVAGLFVVLAIAASSAAASKGAVPKCAASLRTPIHFSTWSAARKKLVPHGAGVLELCRYAGINQHHPHDPSSLSLTKTVIVRDRSVIDKSTSRFNALPLFNPGNHCGFKDDGSTILAYFEYSASHHQVAVAVSLQGCKTVRNGFITDTAYTTTAAGDQLLHFLAHLI